MGDKEKIVSNAESFMAYMTDGNPAIYYSRSEDMDLTIMDVMVDDDYPDDGNITEPDIDDYTTYTTVDSFWGPTTRQEVDDKYYDELQLYKDKQARDRMRSNLESQSLGLYETTLYFSNGSGDDETIASGIVEIESSNSTEKGSFIIYSTYDISGVQKIKLSKLCGEDVNKLDEEIDKFLDSFDDIRQIHIARETQTADLNFPDMDISDIVPVTDADSDAVYVTAYENNEDTGILYSLTTDTAHLGELTKISEDACMATMHDDKIYYMKEVDFDDKVGALYCGSEKIDDDVYLYSRAPYSEAGYLYYKDYDDKDSAGTLYMYQDGKSTKIKDDIYSYYAYTDKYIAVLTDYSLKNHMGDLRIFDGKECTKIDSDVNALIYY